MKVNPIVIKFKPLFKWSRQYDLYVLATRLNEVIDALNNIDDRLAKLEKINEVESVTTPPHN